MYRLNNLSTDHIYVIGDIMIDHYIYGSCDRISPEAPVPVVDIKDEEHTLGGAGNVIKNLKAFGANTGIISVCGNDDGLRIITDELQKLDVPAHSLVTDESRPTTIKTRVISSKHQLIRLDRESKHYINDLTADKILQTLEQEIDKIRILIISDYCKGVMSENLIRSVIDTCKENGVKTIVDSKDPLLSKYRNADIIKPNRKEASLATGIKIVDDKSLKAACEKIAEQTDCEAVIITLSEEGMAIFNNGQLTKIPTKALDIFDVTGAGDTVISAIAFALLNGLSLIEACDLANHAAAIVVAKVGSATATLEEINNFYK